MGLLCVTAAAEDKKPFSGEGWSAVFPMPPKPDEATKDLDLKLWAYETEKGGLLVGVAKLKAAMTQEQQAEYLKSAKAGALKQSQAFEEKEIPVPAKDAIAFEAKVKNGKLRQHIYVRGDTMFQAVVVGEEAFVDSPEAKKFLESFKLDAAK